MKVDAKNTHQANAIDEEHAHGHPDDDVKEDDGDGGFNEHEDVKDDVNQAYMQELKKLSSGYNQATGNADLAKLLMGHDLLVADEDDDDNAKYPIDPVDHVFCWMLCKWHLLGSLNHISMSTLSVDTSALCQTLFQTAQESRMQQLQQQELDK